ncbi:hypothetical protein CEXT_726391 [Caerostris extrusa]|uniref:Uncharacterized protein n=1 Tax=Caerostris extrusa TaxID=172846 RepID=A0AAV4XQN9_CAEEX|nr:hypothetical protein CEXT_726391 [Caerostris extrusa]
MVRSRPSRKMRGGKQHQFFILLFSKGARSGTTPSQATHAYHQLTSDQQLRWFLQYSSLVYCKTLHKSCRKLLRTYNNNKQQCLTKNWFLDKASI